MVPWLTQCFGTNCFKFELDAFDCCSYTRTDHGLDDLDDLDPNLPL